MCHCKLRIDLDRPFEVLLGLAIDSGVGRWES
jgi:hypothetical protein